MNTVFWTILSGVSVYVIGQITLKFIVDPLHSQRETIGRIINFLIYHGNRYASPGLPSRERLLSEAEAEGRKNPRPEPEIDKWLSDREKQLVETKYVARELASDLMVKTQAIPYYGLWEKVGLVRKRSDIRSAQRSLIAISNALLQSGGGPENANRADNIEAALGVVTEFRVDQDDLRSVEGPKPPEEQAVVPESAGSPSSTDG